jgi:osmotically-inducible protein OsmY
MRPLILLVLAALLAGCAAPVIIGGAAAGIAIANDRRTAGTILDDQGIELQTLDLVAADKELIEKCHLNVTSYNGIALLTGECPDEQSRQAIAKLAQRVNKVRQVHNELRIAPQSSSAERHRDSLVTTRVKSFIISDETIEGLHVKVVTEAGVVYLMGLVTRTEGDIAAKLASGAKGVKRVVTLFEYIKKAD